MAYDVFICHSTEDKVVAGEVCSFLERSGFHCWIAPRDIDHGLSWSESIIRGIDESRIILVIVSGFANQSRHVKREVNYAVDESKEVFPFRIEDVQPSGGLGYFLRDLQWFDGFPMPIESHFPRLAASLSKRLQRPKLEASLVNDVRPTEPRVAEDLTSDAAPDPTPILIEQAPFVSSPVEAEPDFAPAPDSTPKLVRLEVREEGDLPRPVEPTREQKQAPAAAVFDEDLDSTPPTGLLSRSVGAWALIVSAAIVVTGFVVIGLNQLDVGNVERGDASNAMSSTSTLEGIDSVANANRDALGMNSAALNKNSNLPAKTPSNGASQPTANASASSTPKPSPATPTPTPKPFSGGVLNGKAVSLPKPLYPPAAAAIRVAGPVSVQVLISETGTVLEATAVSGHSLLRKAAEDAARRARFNPTLLAGQPVKVSGVITYNFVPSLSSANKL